MIEDAWLEDGCREALAGAEDRLSFDAPIHSWADVGKLPLEPRWLNIKPSRFGTLRGLLECIEECEARGIRMYGGGQFELGPGRRQIQRLASVFYADGPNDVAPSEYNEGPARAGLPHEPAAAARRRRLLMNLLRRLPEDGERRFGEELGATLWGGTVYELAPGKKVCPYHWHFGEEEWLLVVSGAPTLRTPEGERVLEPWDVAVFVTRRGGRARGAERHRRAGARRDALDRAPIRRCASIRTAARSASFAGWSRKDGQHGELLNRPEANLDYCGRREWRSSTCSTASSTTARSGRASLPRGARRGRARRGAARRDAVRDAARREALAVSLGARLRGVPRRRHRRPTLRTPEGERELAPGDVVHFPEGEAGAHQLWNDTDEPFRVADRLDEGAAERLRLSRQRQAPDRPAGPAADTPRRPALDYWDGERP